MGEVLTTGKSFKVSHFAVGSGGHDPLDPITALAPDPSDTECPLSFFVDEVDEYYYAGDFCPVFICRLEQGEAVGEISSLCLIATMVYSPDPTDPEVYPTPIQFLFSIATMPIKVRTDTEIWSFSCGVQF